MACPYIGQKGARLKVTMFTFQSAGLCLCGIRKLVSRFMALRNKAAQK